MTVLEKSNINHAVVSPHQTVKCICCYRILMLLNKRQLEKLKEDWWKNKEYLKVCEKPEDQSDGISIQNIGGVFIVIFVGIGMACITLLFEYWYYKYRKNPKIIDVAEAFNKQDNPKLDKFSNDKSIENKGFFKNSMLRSRTQLSNPANPQPQGYSFFKPKFQI